MRPWIIVLSSAVVAVIAAAGLARPELAATPHIALWPALVPLLPALAVAALAAYGLCTVLLIPAALITEAWRLRRHFERGPAQHDPAAPDWTAAFGEGGLRRLVPPPAAVQPGSASANAAVVLQGRFEPREARREVARLFYMMMARTLFLTALIVLAASVVLGAAQQLGPLPIISGAIPTIAAALAVAGLALLALLARIAVDVAAEPLIQAIARLPAEVAETGLLRRATELLETARAPDRRSDAVPAVAVAQIPDRVIEALEQGHRTLSETIERLSATTGGLATTTTSSIEALEAAFRTAAARQQAAVHGAAADNAATTQLRDAVTALTAVLQGIRTAPPPAATETAAGPDPDAARKEREPDLAQELRKLLQEIETAP